MKIKKIVIQKSRTICVDGLINQRDKFRKLTIGLESEPTTHDELNNIEMCYETLSVQLDELMDLEIQKIKDKIKQKNVK